MGCESPAGRYFLQSLSSELITRGASGYPEAWYVSVKSGPEGLGLTKDVKDGVCVQWMDFNDTGTCIAPNAIGKWLGISDTRLELLNQPFGWAWGNYWKLFGRRTSANLAIGASGLHLYAQRFSTKVENTAEIWSQNTGFLFVPIPDGLNLSVLRQSCFWKLHNSGRFLYGKTKRANANRFMIFGESVSNGDGSTTINLAAGSFGANQKATIRLNGDGKYDVLAQTSGFFPDTWELMPARWFNHWPDERPDIRSIELAAPRFVADHLDYTNCRREIANDKINKPGWWRWRVSAKPSPTVFDSFLNGPFGLRARYFMDPKLGVEYEEAVLQAIFKNSDFENEIVWAGADRHHFGKGTKIWPNKERTRTNVYIFNGLWEQCPFLFHNGGFGFDQLAQAGLYASPVMDILRGKHTLRQFKGIRADAWNPNSRFEIIGPWFDANGQHVIDPEKTKRPLVISSVGFV